MHLFTSYNDTKIKFTFRLYKTPSNNIPLLISKHKQDNSFLFTETLELLKTALAQFEI